MPSIWLLIDLYCYQVNGLQLSGIYTLQHFHNHLLIYGSHYRGMVESIEHLNAMGRLLIHGWMDVCR